MFYCFVDNNRTENRAVYILGYEQIEVRPMAVKDAEHQLNLEISENEARKDFSKAERIESLKAENRKSATQFGGGGNISTTVGITKDVVKLEDRQKKLEKELRN